MPSAIRIGSGLGTPGTGSTPASTSAGIELELPAVAEYALWSEDDQQRQPEPHDHEPHLADLRAGDDRLGQQVVAAGLAQDAVGERQDRKSRRLNYSHYCASGMPSSAWKKHMNTIN